jgi:hypothetical protein
MTRLDKVNPLPPVGTRCFYRNDALRLEGWGVLVEPADEIDGSEMPILLPWRGTLHGPVNGGQVGLNMLAPGVGVLPREDVYRIVPAILLWVPNEETK